MSERVGPILRWARRWKGCADMVTETIERERRRGHPVLVSLAVVAVSFASCYLALAAFGACDVGVNQGANSFAVMFIALPGLIIVNAVGVLVVGAVVRRVLGTTASADRWTFVGQATVLILSAYLCWRYAATPADYPSPWCEDNVPPWAPTWLPS